MNESAFLITSLEARRNWKVFFYVLKKKKKTVNSVLYKAKIKIKNLEKTGMRGNQDVLR